LEGVSERAKRVAVSLESARVAADATLAVVKTAFDEGIAAAAKLAAAQDIQVARQAFGDTSNSLVRLTGADTALSEGRHLFRCPMAEGYQHWIQTSKERKNPYMGQNMLACGSNVEWQTPKAVVEADDAQDHSGHDHATGDPAYYTCPMHPSVKQPGPGACPICGMDLSPVSKEEVQTGVIIVDDKRRQLIGVKTGLVEKRHVKRGIRAVGRITYDETRLTDVTLKYKGWIGKLYANATGEKVKRGYPLFSVYSPEVYAAQMEYLMAERSNRGAADAGVRPTSTLVEIARDRLRLWDIPGGTIDQVAKTGKAQKYVPIVSPASGYIVEKNVVEGSTVEAGARLFRIANLDKVWIEADLYESELPLIKEGQAALITLPYLPEKTFEGKVTFLYPYLEGGTRTGRARIELDNKDVSLRPDMFANVRFDIDLGERLVVAESAVIYAGPRRLVFVDLGEGKLRPLRIEVGLKLDDGYEVLSGLKAGDKVVTSGNFLVAAESRLKSAEGQW
jgi:Cu(I)/Ag(I) efflux system membrane fusion protein